MSFLSENVIPGDSGKIFDTDAKTEADLMKIKKYLLKLEGIRDVTYDDNYPRKFTVRTSKVVHIKDVENKVRALGFHAVAKGWLPL